MIPKLSHGFTGGATECKRRCLFDDHCAFFAYWTRTRYCETYLVCDLQTDLDELTQEKLSNVKVFKRLSECEEEIGAGDGRYVKAIGESFPQGVIRTSTPNKNIHCSCLTHLWAICVIVVVPNSVEEKELKRKINRFAPARPFSFMSLMDRSIAPITFTLGKATQEARVYAEIEILPPERCIHTSICTDGTPERICPVMQQPFKPGDAVYVMKPDVPGIFQGKAVKCISAAGIRHISISLTEDQNLAYIRFPDPFGRDHGTQKTAEDYELFFIFDETSLRSGICGRYQMPPQEAPDRDFTPKKGKKKGKHRPVHPSSKKEDASTSQQTISMKQYEQELQPIHKPSTPEFEDSEAYFSKIKEIPAYQPPIEKISPPRIPPQQHGVTAEERRPYDGYPRPGTPELDDPDAYFNAAGRLRQRQPISQEAPSKVAFHLQTIFNFNSKFLTLLLTLPFFILLIFTFHSYCTQTETDYFLIEDGKDAC